MSFIFPQKKNRQIWNLYKLLSFLFLSYSQIFNLNIISLLKWMEKFFVPSLFFYFLFFNTRNMENDEKLLFIIFRILFFILIWLLLLLFVCVFFHIFMLLFLASGFSVFLSLQRREVFPFFFSVFFHHSHKIQHGKNIFSYEKVGFLFLLLYFSNPRKLTPTSRLKNFIFFTVL